MDTTLGISAIQEPYTKVTTYLVSVASLDTRN